MSLGSSEALVLAVVALLLLIPGVALLRAGAFPRRKGATPHCSRCDYIVAGVESGRCPECGQPISSSTIVFGERIRRRGRIWAGVIMLFIALLAGALGIVQGMRLVRWYEFKPTVWVIKDLDGGDPLRAWNELDRRIKAGTFPTDKHGALVDAANRRIANDITPLGVWMREYLESLLGTMSDAQREKYFQQLLMDLDSRSFVMAQVAQKRMENFMKAGHLSAQRRNALLELALAAQAGGLRKPGDDPVGITAQRAMMIMSREWLMEFLGNSVVEGSVNSEQRERFFQNAARVELRVRPTVIVGEELAYQIRYDGRGPSRWWSRKSMGTVRAGGEVRGGGGSSSGSLGGGSTGSWIKVTKPGKQTLELDLTVEIGKSEKEVLYRREVKLKGDFEALAEAPADYIKWLDDPAQKPQLEKSLSVRDAQAPAWRASDLHFVINMDKLPCDIAFEVIARVDGREQVIGSVSNPKGTTSSTGISHDPFPAPKSGKMDVILRGSEQVARRQVEVLTPWKGEIVFRDVPVTPRKK